jgi:hypothetical protein
MSTFLCHQCEDAGWGRLRRPLVGVSTSSFYRTAHKRTVRFNRTNCDHIVNISTLHPLNSSKSYDKMNIDTFYSGAMENSNNTKEKRVCHMQQQLKAPVLQISETRGNPVETSNKQTTPIGRVIQVQLPFASLTWHRPVAVEIRQENTIYRLPIYDSTLCVISAIVLTGLATVLVPVVIQTILFRRRRTS